MRQPEAGMKTSNSEVPADGRVNRRITMEDVAEHAGVALSSVSRALSNHPDVSPAMRRKVELATEELGYEPDFLAQSLRRGSMNTMGFVIRDIANPFFGAIANGAERVLHRNGFVMLLTNSDGLEDLEAEHTQVLKRRRVDGLIMSLVNETDGPTVDLLREIQTPFVLLDREIEGTLAGAVLSDHYQGVREATRDLIELGHRRIALISGSRTIRPTKERIKGMADAFGAAGSQLDERLLVLGAFDAKFARGEVSSLLDITDPPTAIISGGVQSTLGVLEGLADRHLVAGSDVALVACDELPFFDVFRPPISVVARNPERIGEEAARLLLEIAAGGQPRTVTLPTEYRRQASTAPPR